MKVTSICAILLVTVFSLTSCITSGIGVVGSGPDSGGEAYLAVEAHSGKVLAGHNPTATREISGLTQVATAIVIFDWSTATGKSLAENAIVPQDVLALGAANPMGLRPGDQLTLRDGLYSMLMGTDAASAQTLANHVGSEILQRRGGYGSQPVKVFVEEMRQLASALGMTRTRFNSAHGLELNGSGSTSTAEDIARLEIYAMRHPGIAFYTNQKSRKISYFRAGQQLSFQVTNTNSLVGREGINGLKSVRSSIAGSCNLISAERSSLVEKLPGGQSRITPRRMIIVSLGSSNSDGRAYSLLSPSWQSFDQWMTNRAAGVAEAGLAEQLLTVPNL